MLPATSSHHPALIGARMLALLAGLLLVACTDAPDNPPPSGGDAGQGTGGAAGPAAVLAQLGVTGTPGLFGPLRDVRIGGTWAEAESVLGDDAAACRTGEKALKEPVLSRYQVAVNTRTGIVEGASILLYEAADRAALLEQWPPPVEGVHPDMSTVEAGSTRPVRCYFWFLPEPQLRILHVTEMDGSEFAFRHYLPAETLLGAEMPLGFGREAPLVGRTREAIDIAYPGRHGHPSIFLPPVEWNARHTEVKLSFDGNVCVGYQLDLETRAIPEARSRYLELLEQVFGPAQREADTLVFPQATPPVRVDVQTDRLTLRVGTASQ